MLTSAPPIPDIFLRLCNTETAIIAEKFTMADAHFCMTSSQYPSSVVVECALTDC